MNNKTMIKLALLGVMTLILAAFTHCGAEKPKDLGRGPTSNNSTSGGGSVEEVINATQVTTGVKNHEQLLYTMSALTGVPSTNAAVLATYNQVASSLPTSTDVKALLAPNQVAIVKLAAEFCNQLVSSQPMRDAIWNSQNYGTMLNLSTVTVSSLKTTNNMNYLIEGVAKAFWSDMVPLSELQMSEDDLKVLISDLSVGVTDNNAEALKIVKGVCTSALSSGYVTLY